MRVPNIFNMPNVQSMLQPNSSNSFTVSGQPYNGPFGQDTRTPFRTINNTPDGRGAGAYGNGLNASAAQLYDHFRRDGGWAVNAGLPRAGMAQTLEDFAARGRPQGSGNIGGQGKQWSDLTNNNDVLSFMRQNNALGGDALDWAGKWFGESGIGGGKDFLTGSVRNWDYMNSDLDDRNKGIVGDMMNYLGQYWEPIKEAGKGMPADPPTPKIPTAANMGGIFNIDPAMLKEIMGGMR